MPDLPSSSLSHTTNLVEIAWENGQIMVQPQIQSASKPPQSTGDTDFANTDVPWLTNYPTATDDYGIGFLSPEFTGDKSAASTSTSNKLQTTQDPTTTSGFLNFSNFSRPVALHKTNLQNAEKLIAPHPKDNASVVKWDEKGIISSGKETKVPEATLKRRIKKALPEGNYSCNQSKDPDDDSAGCAKKQTTCSTSSTNKRSRAAEVHNLSERRRRDRINEKMKALQELIPNCNKVDKASMLDEAIEYLKTLQFQLQMMSTMGNGGGRSLYMPSTNMMMQPRMPHFPQMGVEMAGMGMFDVSGRPPMMRLPFHYPSSSIPVGQYQSNAVPMVGHPVSSIAHGSSYFPLPTHTTATAAATRMNFGPEVGVNTPATWMMNENSETRQKSVKLGDNDDLQKCG